MSDDVTHPDTLQPVAQREPSPLLALPRLPALPPRLRTAFLRTTVAGATAAYLGAMAVTAFVVTTTSDIPGVEKLTERSRPASVQYLDRYGRHLLTRGGHAAADVKTAELPDHLLHAVLAVEDERYANHIGVDAEGIARAVVTNLRKGRRAQGGSTLTQQLVKNVFLEPDKTYRRKVQEALLSVWLEREYTKDEILEMYLERVYFGAGAYGLSAASLTYFDKPPSELTLSESAMIAGLLKAPSSYTPVNDTTKAGRRAALVLKQMEKLRFIDSSTRAEALSLPLSISPPSQALGANYLADWTQADLRRLTAGLDTDIIVTTTLDLDVQDAAESAVFNHLDDARGASQAAVVTLDGTGGVIGMVGGRSYGESEFNRATQALRQPGSSFKPFVYLAAIESGRTPWDITLDAPVDIDGWQPRNFTDGHLGRITIEDAFAKSLNTVAVTLSEDVGRDRVVATAARFGLDAKPLRSVALGAQGTHVIDMATAYLPFGNWGVARQPYGILTVTTTDGRTLYQASPDPGRTVLEQTPLRHMNRLMTRTVEQGTGRRARVPGRSVAGKTGTTNAHRDAWFVGVAPGVSTAVWVGNDANDPMTRVTGGSIPAQIFSDVMGAVLAEQVPASLPVSATPIYADPASRSLDVLLADIEDVLP